MKIFVAAILLMIVNVAQGAPALTAPIKNLIKKVEAEKKNLQGGAVAIVYKGEVVYQSTFGYAQGKQRPITSHTLFPLASVSKPISALAIALLVKKERVRFEDKIKLPYIQHEISFHEILSHTTGYDFRGDASIEQGLSYEKMADQVALMAPVAAPGQRSLYSNFLFSLVEQVLNTRVLTLQCAVTDLCDALDTQDIRLLSAAPSQSNRDIAYPHKKQKQKKGGTVSTCLPFPPYYPKAAPAAAGIFASLEAMISFLKLSLGHKPNVLSQDDLAYVYNGLRVVNHDINKWHSIKWPGGRKKIESYYALGWRVLVHKDRPEAPFICHAGGISGIRSFIGVLPAEDVGIVILLNQGSKFSFVTGIDFWLDHLK